MQFFIQRACQHTSLFDLPGSVKRRGPGFAEERSAYASNLRKTIYDHVDKWMKGEEKMRTTWPECAAHTGVLDKPACLSMLDGKGGAQKRLGAYRRDVSPCSSGRCIISFLMKLGSSS